MRVGTNTLSTIAYRECVRVNIKYHEVGIHWDSRHGRQPVTEREMFAIGQMFVSLFTNLFHSIFFK